MRDVSVVLQNDLFILKYLLSRSPCLALSLFYNGDTKEHAVALPGGRVTRCRFSCDCWIRIFPVQ
jgi:hypothetical protein